MGSFRFLRTILYAIALAAGFAVQAQTPAQTKGQDAYGRLPLAFELNEGQSDPRVKFLSRGLGYGLFLTGSDTVLALTRTEPGQTPLAKAAKAPIAKKTFRDVLRIKLLGANEQPQVVGMEPLPGRSNYFIGNDPKKWRTNVPQYAKVKSAQVYPGIDLVYYGHQRQLEYDFRVAPGTDPAAIRFTIDGARKMSLNAHGELLLQTPGGDVIERAPLIYQEVDGKRQSIGGGYEVRPVAKADSKAAQGFAVSFRVADYDRGKPLVIDPALTYSTYLGGNNSDQGNGIAVDGSGNAYVAGNTTSSSFPTTTGAFQTALAGDENAFVTELNATGAALIYSTYLGGSDDDLGEGIAVDGSGNAYVTGETNSSNFPTTPGAFQITLGGSNSNIGNAFVAKLNPAGSGSASLVYSTYLGGSGETSGAGVAVDGSGNAYVTGYTVSGNFPTTAGAFQTALGRSGAFNAFVTKLNSTGAALIYSTYLGGSVYDYGEGIAVDGSGNAYVTGETRSSNFPTTAGAFQITLGGSNSNISNAFVAKLNPAGSGSASLVYSTYLGGNTGDFGSGIAVGSSGNAYVTGLTVSGNFPTTADAFQTALAGDENAFVTEMNPTGTALVYSTYLGGSVDDQGGGGETEGFGIALDGSGNAYVTGYTYSSNFPTTTGAFQTALAGSYHAFVAQFALGAKSPQIFVVNYGNSSIGIYSGDGSLINDVTAGVNGPEGVSLSGSDVFITNNTNGTIGEYTTSGATVNASLVSGLSSPYGIVVSGSDLFVTNYGSGTVGEYTTSGGPVNSSLVSGLDDPSGIALSGSDLFVANYTNGTVGEYTTLGAPVNTSLISGLDRPTGIALSGSDIFVVNNFGDTVGEYTTSGATVNTSLISGLNFPAGIAVSGSDLFVINQGDYEISEYTTSGTIVNPSLITGLDEPNGVALVPPTLPTYTVTPSSGGDGGISPNTPQMVTSGGSIGFTATPASGYVVDQWLVDGTSAQYGGNTYTLSNVTADTAVEAIFTPATATCIVTPSAGPNGSISPDSPQVVYSGSSVAFTASPASGYVVNQWLVNGNPVQTGGNSYTLSNVNADASVLVTFAAAGQFFFTVSSAQVQNTDGQVTVTVSRNFSGPASVDYQTLDDTAVAGSNYTATQGTLSFGANQTQATISVPIIQLDSAPGSTYFTIQLSNPSLGATVGASGTVGIYILNDEAADYGLSQTTFTSPTTAPGSAGSITVNLSPSNIGQWRLFGELDWRDSGATATGLTAGNYEVEFKTAVGYQQPALLVVPLTAGQQASVSGTYALNGSPATGSLQVTLVPQGTGGWCFQGETAWRPSGETVSNLNAGDYILEFEPEPATGLVTPQPCEAVVYANQTALVNITYLVGDSTIGQTPVLVSDTVALTQAPYVFTGQIQTDEGLGTGFVPLDRVVVTAAHVLFDDSALSYVQGVRWFSQYENGIFETPAQIPAGSYVLSGYAAQRTVDVGSGVSPGVATTASRELDAAALYFLEPAARGGQSGYLASDSGSNSWLISNRDKFIAGYPVTGVTPTGRLYATPTVQNAFQYLTGSLFSTTAITSYSGNSGGPLFVRFDDGNFYPAAIYLGGSAETVVHAIDSDVIALMNEAEVSGNGGANNSGGGIIEVSEGLSGVTASALGNMHVTIAPKGAVSDGAYWEIVGDNTKRFSGESALGLAPISYVVQFFGGGPGYSLPVPAQANVLITAGGEQDVVANYTPNPPTITSATAATAIEGQPFNYQITVTPNATGYSTASSLPSGLTLNGTTGLISGIVSAEAATGVSSISLTATNAAGPGNPFNLALTVALPGQLNVSGSGKGTVTKAYAKPSVQAVGSSISIKATPAPGYLFAYWSDADTGDVLSIQQVYTFTVSTLLDLQANFVVNPFLTAKGLYSWILQGSDYAHAGFASMTVKANGSFTAVFNLGGSDVKVQNTFSNLGQYQGEFVLPGGRIFNVTLSLTAGGVLTGTLISQSDGSQIHVSAERAAPHADEALAGAYTVVLPAITGTPGLPGGNGFGTLKISKKGAVTFSGNLGDGVPVTISGNMDSNGIWPLLFTKAVGKTTGAELLLGPVTFPPPASGTAGTLSWYRAANSKDPIYPNGFSTQIPILVSPYMAPAVDYTSASVVFSGADPVMSSTEAVTIDINAKDHVTPASGDTTPFSLKFTPGSGLFSGSFPDNGVTLKFSGTVLESGSFGMGLFEEKSGQTGSVLLTPAP